MIIAIARECGSGGHEIGKRLAERFHIEFYDKHNLLEEAKSLGNYDELVSFYEEKPMDSLLYTIAMGEGGGGIGRIPFKHLRDMAEHKSFVILGRCASFVLRDCPDFTSVFIHGETTDRVKYTMEKYNLNEKKAMERIIQVDKKRATFHKYYTGENWDDAKNYQLTLNSSLIGLEKATDIITTYIEGKNRG